MPRSDIPTNSDSIIDSRDVLEWLDDFESREPDELDEDDREAFAALKALADQAEGYADDWKYGAQLIRDSYFKEYAQQVADEIGDGANHGGWPYTCIDWDQAARELRMDYTSVEFDGVTYWVR